MLDTHPRRIGRTLCVVTASVAALCIPLAAVTHPAAAFAVVSAAVSAVRCSATSACVSGTNTSSGAGVAGTSSGGAGVSGTALQPYQSGLAGTNATNQEGGIGVTGKANAIGIGVLGQSPAGDGVVALSSSGNGVFSESAAGIGLFSESSTGTAISAYSGTGSGIAVESSGAGAKAAVVAQNGTGNGGDFFGRITGLIGRAPAASGHPLILTDENAHTVFVVNGVGDVYYRGALRHLTQASGGALLSAYTGSATRPTLEDTGTAQLVGGAAVVHLDPTFAATIDQAATYRVFVTPGGDTAHGLYVTAKTMNGFTVREAQRGRSTVMFDYRIVATPVGQAGQRMTFVSDAAVARADTPSLPAIPVVRLPASAQHP